VQCQSDLLQIVPALSSSGRFASRLNGRQEQGDQNGNDGNNNQQFDQSKSARKTHWGARNQHGITSVKKIERVRSNGGWLVPESAEWLADNNLRY
jgi:hypothetical protein